MKSGNFFMDKKNVSAIIDYIRCYGIETHYAVVIRLDPTYCKNPTWKNMMNNLPSSVMSAMSLRLNQKEGIYNPSPPVNIVAARPKFKPREHAEFRLLTGGQNSPVEKMLAHKDKNSCLIFFSKLSPCLQLCLNQTEMNNIVNLVNPLFNRYNRDSRAFVFETIYEPDAQKGTEIVLEAWKLIKDAPLFRYPRNAALCFDNNNQPSNKSPCWDD
ncbi:uncharacterized protein LOC112541093 [Python bivittatus]|uniref:Uncharacterized protein LOC112541093 n=1 Tax=Python bivittatus TaxID=176946 RepID=A0A9F5IWA2_PYTBI|nr:uncharacterized protein LOC112541093 [Python bivittatus]